MNVLVVDDYRETADLLGELLELDGHVVRCSYTAQAALEMISAHPCDVALIDIRLQAESGFALARAIRECLSTPVKLIAISGLPKNHHPCLEPFDYYLEKPVSFDELNRLLKGGSRQ